jgi:cytochrome b subunit of formate dehydrogenase
MRWMIYGVWALGGLHALLWLQRGLKERKRIHAACRPTSGRWYERWRPTYRALHLMLVGSFLLLALTGLPLRYHDTDWASGIYTFLGGPPVVRFLHRFAAFVTFAYFATYLVHLVRRMLRGEKGLFTGPTSMVPRWKDLQDVGAHVRWFLRGGARPKFDRWTYWEKFDYWAVFWGVAVIGLSGLVLWFPVQATRFLPGTAINLAHAVHSHEALLATSFIFTLHFFHANLRPGKFPMDTVFLTGRISEEELKFEHEAEWERMRDEGRLEKEALPPPPRHLVRRAHWVGGLLLSIGLGILVLLLTTVVG